MIYIHPVGGLTNMLFHIASIWCLAKDNNDELCLLNIDEKIKDLIKDSRWNGKHAPIFKYIFNRFPQKEGDIIESIYHTFHFTHLQYKSEYKYIGYFQCEKYFKHRRNEILELFRPDNSFLDNINKYSDLFGNISLHVRRGDYVYTQYAHPLQSMEYYNKALSLLPDDKKVLIFSDDMIWCKTNFIGDRFIFIEEMDYICLYIMARMDYHIIANSSFSWWGAWMSESKKVIAPINWFSCCFSDIDIIPENWIRI